MRIDFDCGMVNADCGMKIGYRFIFHKEAHRFDSVGFLVGFENRAVEPHCVGFEKPIALVKKIIPQSALKTPQSEIHIPKSNLLVLP